MSHKTKLQPDPKVTRGLVGRKFNFERKNQSVSKRRDVTAGPLIGRERTLTVLLHEAFRIKEEVSAGLRSTQGSARLDTMSNKLLENHILTITGIVKQLGMDIQALERQIAQRDSLTGVTTAAVQSLDQKNMAGIGDLRGRVARCDACIAKLSADFSSGERRLITLHQEMAQIRSAVDVGLREMEVKIYGDQRRLEASVSEHSQGQRSSMSDVQTRVKLVEASMSGELKEAKEQREWLRKWTEQQLNSSAQRCTQQQDKLLQAASRLSERLGALEVRVEQLETQQDLVQGSCDYILKRTRVHESKLSERVTSVERSLPRELQLIKQEYHRGFQSVHDAIESLKQIGDFKSRLDKEKLHKDIRHIRSKAPELIDA